MNWISVYDRLPTESGSYLCRVVKFDEGSSSENTAIIYFDKWRQAWITDWWEMVVKWRDALTPYPI